MRSPWPAIKIAGEWEPPGKGPDVDLERRVAYGLMHIPANALSQDLVTLTEFRMIPRDGGWLVMLKGTRRGKKLVAFIHGPTWRDAMRTATTSVDCGHAVWREDKPKPWST